MSDMAKAMWDKIDEAREAKGLNWAQFAKLIGERESRVSKWRGGTGEPDRHQLLRMGDVLGLDVRYLADDSIDDAKGTWDLADDEKAVLATYRAYRPSLAQGIVIRAIAAVANRQVAARAITPQPGSVPVYDDGVYDLRTPEEKAEAARREAAARAAEHPPKRRRGQ